MSGSRSASRATVFAQGALKKRLVSRQQAEECLAIARKLKQRGKALAIETIFVRKGYLTKAEANSLAARLRPKAKATAATAPAGGLALADEPEVCRSCGKDPGDGDDCFRCGADLETGQPGPRATLCDGCGQVVLRTTALCPRCARPIARRPERGGRPNVLLERLILLTTLCGVAYFLVYLTFFKPPAPELELTDDVAPVEFARRALAKGDRARAVRALEDGLTALGDDPPSDEALDLLRALTLVAEPARAREAARRALAIGPDPAVHLRLARLNLDAGDAEAAQRELDAVPTRARDDEHHRLRAEAEQALGGDWLEALLQVEEPTPTEARRLAGALLERGRAHAKAGRTPQAKADLERACALAPKSAATHLALGMVLLEAGEPEPAAAALRHAVERDGRAATPHLALALALERTGDLAGAKTHYRKFVERAKAEGGQAARIRRVEARLKALSR